MQLLVRFLLPREDKRVYNLKVCRHRGHRPDGRVCVYVCGWCVFGLAPFVWYCVVAHHGKLRFAWRAQEKQLVKVLAPLLGTPIAEMRRDVEQGCVVPCRAPRPAAPIVGTHRLAVDLCRDISATAAKFFKGSMNFPPAVKSTLSLFDVNGVLNQLSTATKEQEQTDIFSRLLVRWAVAWP